MKLNWNFQRARGFRQKGIGMLGGGGGKDIFWRNTMDYEKNHQQGEN